MRSPPPGACARASCCPLPDAMPATRLILLGIAAYAAFLLATLPAAVLAPQVEAATSGKARLENAAGTVWDGSARVVVSGRHIPFTLDEVRWRFLPARLLAGRAAFAVQARVRELRAEGEASRSPLAWRVDGLRAAGDASALVALAPLATAWQPSGTLAIEAQQFTWDGERATGGATIDWQDAALALSAVRPLGSWRVQATTEGAAVKVALATTKGPLRLAGNGTIAIPGRLVFSGEARAEPGRERDLESVLALFGPRRADGAHALELR